MQPEPVTFRLTPAELIEQIRLNKMVSAGPDLGPSAVDFG